MFAACLFILKCLTSISSCLLVSNFSVFLFREPSWRSLVCCLLFYFLISLISFYFFTFSEVPKDDIICLFYYLVFKTLSLVQVVNRYFTIKPDAFHTMQFAHI